MSIKTAYFRIFFILDINIKSMDIMLSSLDKSDKIYSFYCPNCKILFQQPIQYKFNYQEIETLNLKQQLEHLNKENIQLKQE